MKRKAAFALAVAVLFVLLFAVVVLAQENGEEPPWSGLELKIGGVAILWGGVVAALVEIGKHVYFTDEPFLNTPAKIWGANLVLGGLGIMIYELLQGTAILQAALAALAAVISASGLFEAAKTAVGKSYGGQSKGASQNGLPNPNGTNGS